MIRKALSTIAFLLLATAAHATTATPVTVSTVTVAGNVVTVNATAHGLSATLPSAFCISGSSVTQLNVCGVVATAAANSFTFAMTGAPTCASSCGTVLPSPRVIVLSTPASAGGFTANYMLWIATTSPIGSKATAWTAASTQQAAAVTAGSLQEMSRSQFFPVGTTLTQAQSYMVNDWTSQQSAQTSGLQPGAFASDFYDGTGWVQ